MATMESLGDFFNTIQEAGISDIAAEVGIISESAPAPMNETHTTAAAAEPTTAVSNGGGSSSYTLGPDQPSAYVSMPLTGPQVPDGLQNTLALAAEPAAKKKRLQRAHGGKQGDKGLRHFSMKVCEKVEQKGKTTYNEVADELVAEFALDANDGGGSTLDAQYDEKNIRRRVYDALNVLMAMDIITKEKKNIMWRGLPTNTEQEGARLKMDLTQRKERLEKKRLHLQELLTQQISFKSLVQRNSAPPQPGDRIPLPFIIVNTHKETVIDCEMAEDKQEIFFNFSAPFEIHDDNEIMKRMQLHSCSTQRELESLVPPHLAPYTNSWQPHWQPQLLQPPPQQLQLQQPQQQLPQQQQQLLQQQQPAGDVANGVVPMIVAQNAGS